MFYYLIGLALLIAVADWWAVYTENRSAEYVLKPLVMVILIAATLAMSTPDPATARPLILAGLVASLIGDVFLMLKDRFVPGLAAFLVAHLFYAVGFMLMGIIGLPFIAGLLIAVIVFRRLGVRIVTGAVESNRSLGVPVALYITAISVMFMFATGTFRPAAIVGATLFCLSDSLIGWTRFVKDIPNGRVYIMVTYHLAQVGIVLSLLGTA